jgi:hypothetical protein
LGGGGEGRGSTIVTNPKSANGAINTGGGGGAGNGGSGIVIITYLSSP